MGQESQTYELRQLDAVEVRIADDKPRTVTGRVVTYGALSKQLGKGTSAFRERIMPGALTRTLGDGHDIRALLNHEPAQPLGRLSTRTLRLVADDSGLIAEADLPDTSYANDLAALIKRGDATGMSFGFKVPRGGDRFHREGADSIRSVTDLDLVEVSFLVMPPAYDSTTISLRVDPAALESAKALIERPRLAETWRKFRRSLAA